MLLKSIMIRVQVNNNLTYSTLAMYWSIIKIHICFSYLDILKQFTKSVISFQSLQLIIVLAANWQGCLIYFILYERVYAEKPFGKPFYIWSLANWYLGSFSIKEQILQQTVTYASILIFILNNRCHSLSTQQLPIPMRDVDAL